MPTPSKNISKKSSAKSAAPIKKAAPKAKPGDKRLGNKFYLQCSKYGRTPLFEDANLLFEQALEYFKLCDDTPFLYEDVSAGKKVITKKQRPYILEGLCNYLNCSVEWFRSNEIRAREKNDEEFIGVFARIRGILYEQKASGAVTGVFNHQIVSRILGIRDAVDGTLDGEIKNKVELTDDQFTKLLNQAKSNKEND